ncbi:hypothetical protein BC629DRAFT_1596723 [Irpex lacteus]|nr:hypothetical protein BC629DRAFT_1596723 [Irpex lacteus]
MSEDEDQDVVGPIVNLPDNDDARRARYKQVATVDTTLSRKRKAEYVIELNLKGVRDAPSNVRICCDLHDGAKELIDTLHPPTTIERPPCAPRRSPLKDYNASAAYMELKDFLHNWRVSKVLEKFGQGLANFGHHNAKRNAHAALTIARSGILSISSERETKWDGTEVFGDEVLALIRQVHPPFTSDPLPSAASSATVQAGPRKERTCSACGGTGHIQVPSLAPPKARESAAAKENVPRTSSTYRLANIMPPPIAIPSRPVPSTSIPSGSVSAPASGSRQRYDILASPAQTTPRTVFAVSALQRS